MITIVEGTLGGGKTVYAVRQSIERVSKGGHVYTNVDMVESKVRAYLLKKHGVYMRTGQITRLPDGDNVSNWLDVIPFGTLEAPILVVLDEAQMFWNARDWEKTHKAAKEGNPMLSFLTQSRKAGVDLMIISQDQKNVDSQFRRLAEVVVKARNLGNIRAPIIGLKLKGFFHYSYTETAANNTFERQWWKADSDVFDCYRTEAFLDSLMQGMADTKERLQRFALRRVIWQRRLVASLENGDAIEKFVGRLLRGWAAGALRKHRKATHENCNCDSSIGGHRLGKLEDSGRVQGQAA